jgi:hypothetical protein
MFQCKLAAIISILLCLSQAYSQTLQVHSFKMIYHDQETTAKDTKFKCSYSQTNALVPQLEVESLTLANDKQMSYMLFHSKELKKRYQMAACSVSLTDSSRTFKVQAPHISMGTASGKISLFSNLVSASLKAIPLTETLAQLLDSCPIDDNQCTETLAQLKLIETLTLQDQILYYITPAKDRHITMILFGVHRHSNNIDCYALQMDEAFWNSFIEYITINIGTQ